MALKFRRGTTAQQSGSLAFGEPYVNTTLGTLLVGGASGDIQLSNAGPTSTFAGASVSASSFVSASTLKVTGNASVGGELIIQSGSNPQVCLNNDSTGIEYHIQNSNDGRFEIHNANTNRILFQFQSSSLEHGNQNASFFGDLSVSRSLFVSAISASAVTASIYATNGIVSGSSQLPTLATTGSNTFNGNQTVNGLVQASGSTGYHTFTGASRFIDGQVSFENNTTVVHGALSFLNPSQNAGLTLQNIGPSGSNKLILAVQELEILGDTTLSGSFTLNGYPLVNSNQINTLLPTGVISGSSQLDGTNITNLTITNLTTVNQTASVVFSSGSNRFGDAGNDVHSFTGSVQISGSLTTIGTSTATSFNGAINANNGVVSGSSQIDHNSTTNYVANRHIDHTSVLISAGNGLSGGGDISSTRTLTLDTTSSTFTTGVKTALNSNTVISGSSQVDVTLTTGDIALGSRTSGNYVASLVAGTNITLSNNSGESATPTIGLTNNSITIAGTSTALGGTITAATILSGTGVVSGSSQITAGSTTNFATDVKTQLNSNTVVSGSGQVAIASTSGFGTYINQPLLTNSAVTHGNLTINGTITATGDITAFFTSDIRHKNNIELIDNALDKVNALNGVTWEWNDDVDEVTKQTPKTGLIAQDVLDVLPEVVKTRENGFLALDYSKMVGLLVEAIKEQDIVIQKLKSDVVGLSKTITVFEDRMKEKGLL